MAPPPFRFAGGAPSSTGVPGEGRFQRKGGKQVIWSQADEHARRVKAGEENGYCPGCGRTTSTFATVVLPDVDLIGCCCAECIDGETIERLDPRQDAALMQAALRESDRRWRERDASGSSE